MRDDVDLFLPQPKRSPWPARVLAAAFAAGCVFAALVG